MQRASTQKVFKALRFSLFTTLAISQFSHGGEFDFQIRDAETQSDVEIRPEPLPQSAGSLGDSISAGAIAGFKRQNFILPWEPLILLAKALKYGLTHKLASFENRDLSWAMGMGDDLKVWSHGRRLAGLAGKRGMPIFNAAVSGAESLDMYEEQVPRLRAWSHKTLGQEFPDYVTILVGANDVCADSTKEMNSTEDFFNNLEKTVDDILDSSPSSKVLISSLPNIENLRTIAKDARVLPSLKCEAMWRKTGLCPTLTSLSDPETRKAVAERVRQYNEAMNHLVESRNSVFGNRLRYVSDTYDFKFTPDDLSIDCFHPNWSGQDQLADVSFQKTWWAAEWNQRGSKIRKEWQDYKKLKDYCRSISAGERRKPAECRQFK